MRKQVNLRLDEEVYRRVEELRGDVDRQKWLERAVRMRIKIEDHARRGPAATERTVEELRRRPTRTAR